MALPVSRNTTYAPGSQVKSVDLNALQDVQVADHGTRHRMFAGASGQEGIRAPGADPFWYSAGTHKTSTISTPNLLTIPFVVESGDVITATITVEYATGVPAGAGNTVTLFRENGSGTLTNIASVAIANTAGPQTITLVTAHTVVAQNSYAVQIDMGLITSAGNKYVYHVDLAVTRP